MRRRAFCLASVVLVTVACQIGPSTEPSIADGESCAGHIEQCKSKSCIYDLCAGSSCKCNGPCGPGSPSSDCAAGWLCYHGESSSDFLGRGGGPFDECRAPCGADGGCPPRLKCSLDGITCTTDPQWSVPRVTITASIDVDAAIAPGTAVTLHGAATSPVGDGTLAFGWSLPSDDGKGSRGETTPDIELHPTAPSSAYGVTLTVTDSQNRRGTAVVAIKVCGTAGVFCAGTDPSDIPCCAGLSCQSFKCQ